MRRLFAWIWTGGLLNVLPLNHSDWFEDWIWLSRNINVEGKLSLWQHTGIWGTGGVSLILLTFDAIGRWVFRLSIWLLYVKCKGFRCQLNRRFCGSQVTADALEEMSIICPLRKPNHGARTFRLWSSYCPGRHKYLLTLFYRLFINTGGVIASHRPQKVFITVFTRVQPSLDG